jgi:hypothetical protein
MAIEESVGVADCYRDRAFCRRSAVRCSQCPANGLWLRSVFSPAISIIECHSIAQVVVSSFRYGPP